MNVETGKIVTAEDLAQFPAQEQKKFIEVKRDLTQSEAARGQIKLYSPCGCGSGRKFKFCCHQKPKP